MKRMNRRKTEMDRVRPRWPDLANRMRWLGLQSTKRQPTPAPTSDTSMKHHHTLMITCIAVTAFALGCKPSEEKTPTTDSKSTAQAMDSIAKDTKAVAQDMKDYAYAQKSEFVAAMQGQMAEIDRDLEQLSAKIEKSSNAAKAEAQPKFQALRDQAAKLNKQVDEAKNATESTWDDVKAGFKKGYGELKEGFQQARQWVSDKIAP